MKTLINYTLKKDCVIYNVELCIYIILQNNIVVSLSVLNDDYYTFVIDNSVYTVFKKNI